MHSPSCLTLVLGLGLAGCAGTTGQPSSPAGDFAHYRSLPNYRAMAVTGGELAGSSYASGWSSAATSIDGAVEVAMRECRARRQPAQPPCELYAIGDLVVAGSDAATLARAECIYILEPAATSLASRYADACAAAAKAAAKPAATSGTGAKLNAREVQDGIIGHTLAVKGAAFIFLAPAGTAELRTADPVFGPDQGSWRLRPDGDLCLWWRRARAGRELCHELRRSGDAYVLGDLPVTVIDDNPFRL
jgi:hypothetical protein